MNKDSRRPIFEHSYRQVSVADHETLISFCDDDENVEFMTWLETRGWADFLAWQAEQEDE